MKKIRQRPIDRSQASILFRFQRLAYQLSKDRRKVLRDLHPEALHDFRVTLRRLRAGLRYFGDKAPATRDLKEQAKRIAANTNPVRDQEVLCQNLRSLPPLEPISLELESWIQAQESVLRSQRAALHEFLSSPLIRSWNSHLPSRLKTISIHIKAAGHRFQKDLHDLSRFLEHSLRSKPSGRLIHRLRVKAKWLRYGSEEFDLPFSRRLLRSFRDAQDQLGQCRDLTNLEKKLKAAGRSRFPGIRSWFREIAQRKERTWKEYRRTARKLHRKM